MEYTIDAQGKALGRVATEAAMILMGKNTPDFSKEKLSGHTVTIVNASKVAITEKKLKETLHERYSGYPGGLKFATAEQVVAKKGYAELFRLAIYGMLPGNKLRPRMMKRLIITE